MPSGCCVCNPFCGKCQPAPFKSTHCPECNTVNLFTRHQLLQDDVLACKKCGYDLEAEIRPKVTYCRHSGLLCAYPCSRCSVVPPEEFETLSCERNTPPSKAWLEAHPGAQQFCIDKSQGHIPIKTPAEHAGSSGDPLQNQACQTRQKQRETEIPSKRALSLN